MIDEQTGVNVDAYTLIGLLAPGASKDVIDDIAEVVSKTAGAKAYKTEYTSRELCYKIGGYGTATVLVVCWVAKPERVEEVWNKLRYDTRLLRYLIVKEKARNDSSRLEDTPLRFSGGTTQIANPALANYVTEGGKILPRKFTGFTAKNQRALSYAIKAGRTMAFLKL